MSTPRPTFCLYGGCTAVYRVKSTHREAVVCGAHLARADKWAGAGALTERLDGQPAARAVEQLDLFTTTVLEGK